MWRNSLTGIFLFFWGFVAHATVLEGIRYHRMDNRIQLVLDLDAPTTFRQFSLADPPRIVLDLPDTRRDGRAGITIDKGSVRSIRTGYRTQEVLRVVIDLLRVAKANIYTLPAEEGRKDRIIIDVYDAERAPALTLSSLSGGQMPFVTFAGAALEDKPGYDENISLATAAGNANVKQEEKLSALISLSLPNHVDRALTLERQISSAGKVEQQQTTRKPTLTRRNNITICIDPGHGGKDPGAHSSVTGAREKDVVLAIAKRLRSLLDAVPGYHVKMTRDRDIFIPLYQRSQICRRAAGDLFISVHADAVKSQQPTGSSVYILSTRGASSQLARYLANSENAVDLKWGVDVGKYDDDIQEALLNIQQEATLGSSNIFASQVLSALEKVGDIHRSTVERANFVVLRSPEIPSILIETGFISNPHEARLLVKPSYQQKIAQAIATGIRNYFREHLPQNMLLEH